MAKHSQVGVRMAPCFYGIFLDTVHATVDSPAVGEPLNFEICETVCKWKFDIQYEETFYDPNFTMPRADFSFFLLLYK